MAWSCSDDDKAAKKSCQLLFSFIIFHTVPRLEWEQRDIYINFGLHGVKVKSGLIHLSFFACDSLRFYYCSLLGPFESSLFWLRQICIRSHHLLPFSTQVTESVSGSWSFISLTFWGPYTSKRWGGNVWTMAIENELLMLFPGLSFKAVLCSILSGIWFQFVLRVP